MTVIKQLHASDRIADILIVEDEQSLTQWMKKYLLFTFNTLSRYSSPYLISKTPLVNLVF